MFSFILKIYKVIKISRDKIFSVNKHEGERNMIDLNRVIDEG
jgi:hypothetical protein